MLKSAEKIVKILNQNGFIAYFAGGAVRDQLLNRKVADIDIATNAKPDEIEKLFEKTHPIGREFGVMLVIFGEHAFEVATFRGEKDYDGRKPREIFFTDAEKDARRRDFTVNGMFFDPQQNHILDFIDGQKDLKKKILRNTFPEMISLKKTGFRRSKPTSMVFLPIMLYTDARFMAVNDLPSPLIEEVTIITNRSC